MRPATAEGDALRSAPKGRTEPMRTLLTWRLAAALLLLVLPALAAVAPAAPAAAIAADRDTRQSDDGNRGHGNDPDGVDEDNPGKSKGKDKKEKDKPEKRDKGVAAVPGEGYTVSVDCDLDAESGRTTCTVTATAPDGGKDVGFVQLPAEALCADVLETDAEYTDPQPSTHITGYTARDDAGGFSLVLAGEVTVAGTTTWWIKTGDGVFPVEGPGFACAQVEAEAPASDANTGATFTTPTPTLAPETGSVTVTTYSCGDRPADPAGHDWFGACTPGGPTRTVTLAAEGAAEPLATGETDAAGEAVFADLAAGAYTLDLVDGSWCHAKADRVTAESAVVVEPGAVTNVYLFLCERAGV